MSCKQTKWGFCFWRFLHGMFAGYSEVPTIEEMMAVRDTVYGFRYTLPCTSCRKNFIIKLEQMPLTIAILSSRDTLQKWGVNIHNSINFDIGKPQVAHVTMILQYELATGCKLSEQSIILRESLTTSIRNKGYNIFDISGVPHVHMDSRDIQLDDYLLHYVLDSHQHHICLFHDHIHVTSPHHHA